ncbi:MAG: alpha/beta hydrolase [Deltaproteobacteria bacterium]|nr:alpha/beta hydrolase [Deltaproteobacteria bacterium]
MAIEFIRTISEGKKIYGILHLPKNPSPPCVIASHGLFSSKESEKFVALGEFFSAQGIALIRYDHQGCGESEGELGSTTASSRIKDLNAIFELAANHPLLGDRLGLLGSSMGGFISIFKGAADFRVKALALWATPSHLGGKRDRDDEQNPSLGDAFYRDLDRYDATGAIQKVGNCLLLHGEADELVPLTQAKELYQAARTPKHLEVFPGGDHRFTNPQHRLRAIRMSLEWFQRYL